MMNGLFFRNRWQVDRAGHLRKAGAGAARDEGRAVAFRAMAAVGGLRNRRIVAAILVTATVKACRDGNQE